MSIDAQPIQRWWLCWSFRQACPHIETEAAGVRTNLEAFKDNRAVDFVPIGVFGSCEEASAMAARWRAEMRQREGRRFSMSIDAQPMRRWWLCWSYRRACMHIEPEEAGLRTNLEARNREHRTDFVPIGIFESLEEARAMEARLRPETRRRREALIEKEGA